MTEPQREVYMTMLLAGRESEATAYRDRCDAEARANAKTDYRDKHGEKILAGMLIRIDGGEPEKVYPCGDDDLGVNASNPAYLEAHPEHWPECYPLSNFSRADIEIVKEDT